MERKDAKAEKSEATKYVNLQKEIVSKLGPVVVLIFAFLLWY